MLGDRHFSKAATCVCDVQMSRHFASQFAGATAVRNGTDSTEEFERFVDLEKAEALTGIIGGVAHDCNNLLSSILAHAELALADLALGVSPNEAIERMKALAVRTSEIVRELMIYSGQESPEAELLDISALISEMVRLLEVLVPKGVEIQTRLGAHLPAIKASAPRLRQVVLNLIVNASEAIGDADGRIGISTRRAIMRQDSVLAGGVHLPSGDFVVLKVWDSGQGMSEQTQERAFAPFFTTKRYGRGLGLAVVRDIIREHGGAIGLDSRPGKGTAFHVFLPSEGKLPRRVSSISRPVLLKDTRGAGISVLMVEDEEALRLAVSKMLRKQGFEVLEAREGYSAVEVFREHANRIDVVLLDLTLPGASSRYVLEQVRRIRPVAKIVLTTAYSKEAAVAGFDCPFSGFIRKPYELPDLVKALRAAVCA